MPVTLNDITTYESNGMDFIYDIDLRDGFISYYPNEEIEVAGHNSDLTYLYFVKPVEEGRLIDSVDDSIFYGASYLIAGGSEAGSIVNDLLEKLNGKYGKPDNRKVEYTINKVYTDVADEYVWKGENSVIITLFREKNMEMINLSYIWCDAEAMIEKVYAISSSIEESSIEGNTNGL